MSSPSKQQPYFDLLEIEQELLLQFKKYEPLNPLKKGDTIPALTFTNNANSWQQFFNGSESINHLYTSQLLNKPLVISFYNSNWQNQGLDFLKQLNAINSEIRANGGNHIIITDKSNYELEKAAWNNNLTLNFYFDTTHRLAKKFGIYDKNSPVWERFSGIDEHVPLLASFVITPYNQIVFDYTNWHAEKPFEAIQLVEAVYQTSLYLNARKSA